MHVLLRLAAVSLCCTGCAWSPYSPYSGGYYGGGSYYNSPYPSSGGYMTPGPTYVPQNSGPMLNSPSSPTPITPSTPSSPTPNWRTPSNNTGTDAPPFRQDPPSNPVPLPRDNDPFGAPPAAAISRPPSLASRPPFPETPVHTASALAENPFAEPARLPADTAAQPMPAETVPYAYDGAKYEWLKGIVDYDDESKTWAIIYSLSPDSADRFGGTMLLADGAALRDLQPGDLVLLAGTPHPTLQDSRRLPLYNVSKVTTLKRRTEP